MSSRTTPSGIAQGAVAVAFVAVLAGCSYGGLSGIDENSQSEPESVLEEPTDVELPDLMRTPWDCYYEPTINEDWHDDVVCTDGVDFQRPILLAEQGFVTEEEMVAAGDLYEAQLNIGSPVRPSWDEDPNEPPSWVTDAPLG